MASIGGKKGRHEGQSRRDWSALPNPALLSIAMALTGRLADVLTFRRVCTTWWSVAKDNEKDLMSSLPPLLFRDRNVDFYCLADGRSYRNGRLAALLEGEGHVEAVGCSFGHLIIRHLDVDPYCKGFLIVNPLTGTCACRFSPNYRPMVRWAALSSPPASKDCVLWSFDGQCMEFCRLGENKWTVLLSNCLFHSPQPAFHCGTGYVSYHDDLAALDVVPCSSGLTVLPAGGLVAPTRLGEVHLCVADAEILQIRVVYHADSGRMKKFRLYKFDFSAVDWVRVYDLGDRALLWDACGASLSENPGRWGGCGNCIYFVNLDVGKLGVFHLESGKVEDLPLRCPSYHKFCLQSLIWVQ